MSRAARGDRTALEHVFRVLQPVVARFCVRMLRDPALGADAAQRALVKLFQAAYRFDDAGDVVAWALTLATWECRSLRRRPRAFEPVPGDLAAPLMPDDDHERRELRREVTELVGALSADDQATLEAAFGANPQQAMASAAFRKRKQRAIERLKRAWRLRHE